MKYILILLLFLTSCTVVNEPKEVKYEVFSSYPSFTVSYLTYTGVVLTDIVHSYEWRKTFPVDSGSPGYLLVVGDSVQTLQGRIYYDRKLIREQVVQDTLPEIEFNVILY